MKKAAVPSILVVVVLLALGVIAEASRGARAGVDYSALGGTSCGRFREGIRCAEQAAPGWTLRARRAR